MSNRSVTQACVLSYVNYAVNYCYYESEAFESSLRLCLFDFLIQEPRLLEQSSKGNCLNEV